MNQRILWKQFDLIGQALMLLPFVSIAFPDAHRYALLTFFSVGTWQAVSCALNHKSSVNRRRKEYGTALCWIISVLGISILAGWLLTLAGFAFASLRELMNAILLLEFFCLMLISPFLAFWYARITKDELRLMKDAIKHRAEVHWKL